MIDPVNLERVEAIKALRTLFGTMYPVRWRPYTA